MYLMLREFVHVVNVVFKNFIQWPKGHDITYVIDGFKDLSGLPIKSLKFTFKSQKVKYLLLIIIFSKVSFIVFKCK
jgi:hypothetical protein